jgi:HPt (histidine-containing phosphotransfer) domain-containing protein
VPAAAASGGTDDHLVETYLGDGTAQLAAIEAATRDGEADALVRPAHTLKSASRTVGASRLGELCRQIEMLGRSGSTTGAAELAAEARTEWSDVEAALRAWLSDGAAT